MLFRRTSCPTLSFSPATLLWRENCWCSADFTMLASTNSQSSRIFFLRLLLYSEGSGHLEGLEGLESEEMEGWTQTEPHVKTVPLLHVLWSYTGIAAFEGAPLSPHHFQHGCGVGSEVIFSCILQVHPPQDDMGLCGTSSPKGLAEVTKNLNLKVLSLIRM